MNILKELFSAFTYTFFFAFLQLLKEIEIFA